MEPLRWKYDRDLHTATAVDGSARRTYQVGRDTGDGRRWAAVAFEDDGSNYCVVVASRCKTMRAAKQACEDERKRLAKEGRAMFNPDTELPKPENVDQATRERNAWCQTAARHATNEEHYRKQRDAFLLEALANPALAEVADRVVGEGWRNLIAEAAGPPCRYCEIPGVPRLPKTRKCSADGFVLCIARHGDGADRVKAVAEAEGLTHVSAAVDRIKARRTVEPCAKYGCHRPPRGETIYCDEHHEHWCASLKVDKPEPEDCNCHDFEVPR